MDTTKLRQRLAVQGYIAELWHIDDVREMRPDLSDKQCMEVLLQCERKHDATIGITWDVLRIWADDMFPEQASQKPSR
jgi:hypothetical protein